MKRNPFARRAAPELSRKIESQMMLLKPWRYILAVLVVALACLIDWMSSPSTASVFFMPYLAAVMVASIYGGWRPGLLAACLSGAKISFFHLPPLLSFAVARPEDRVKLGFFFLLSALMVSVGEQLKRNYLLAEGRRRELHEFMNHLSHAVIWEFDIRAVRYVFVSQGTERLFGYRADDWLQEPMFLSARTHPDDRPLFLDILRRVSAGENDLSCEHQVVDSQGRALWCHTTVHLDREGRYPKLRGLTIDVTALKKTQDELARAIHARDEVIAIVSHDLKNPIAAVDLNVALLKEKTAQNCRADFVRERVDVIGQMSHRMNRLISDLLDISRIEAGRLPLRPVVCDIATVVAVGTGDVRELAVNKGVLIEERVSCPDEKTVCDNMRMSQVFANILGNSIKFVPEKNGRIIIQADCRDDEIIFSITDNGPGIPADQLDRIFDRFEQARRTRQGGTGLGLAIARGIIVAHQGRIWAESGPNQGTTIHFTIPKLGTAKAELLKRAS